MVDKNDLKIDTYKSGEGTFRTAVRVTHVPSNTVVSVEEFHNQLKNKAEAIKRLENILHDKALRPYEGDPGDESDHDRWEAEGGA